MLNNNLFPNKMKEWIIMLLKANIMIIWIKTLILILKSKINQYIPPKKWIMKIFKNNILIQIWQIKITKNYMNKSLKLMSLEKSKDIKIKMKFIMIRIKNKGICIQILRIIKNINNKNMNNQWMFLKNNKNIIPKLNPKYNNL